MLHNQSNMCLSFFLNMLFYVKISLLLEMMTNNLKHVEDNKLDNDLSTPFWTVIFSHFLHPGHSQMSTNYVCGAAKWHGF